MLHILGNSSFKTNGSCVPLVPCCSCRFDWRKSLYSWKEFWNLLMIDFDRPEVTLCSWQSDLKSKFTIPRCSWWLFVLTIGVHSADISQPPYPDSIVGDICMRYNLDWWLTSRLTWRTHWPSLPFTHQKLTSAQDFCHGTSVLLNISLVISRQDCLARE